MHTPQALLDLHERAHGSLKKLLAHCRQFSAEELDRELTGFGYPSVRRQLHHAIGGEEYWIGVLEGRLQVDDNDLDSASSGARVHAHPDTHLPPPGTDCCDV